MHLLQKSSGISGKAISSSRGLTGLPGRMLDGGIVAGHDDNLQGGGVGGNRRCAARRSPTPLPRATRGRRMQRSVSDRCAGADAGGWRAMAVMVGHRPREWRTIDGGPQAGSPCRVDGCSVGGQGVSPTHPSRPEDIPRGLEGLLDGGRARGNGGKRDIASNKPHTKESGCRLTPHPPPVLLMIHATIDR